MREPLTENKDYKLWVVIWALLGSVFGISILFFGMILTPDQTLHRLTGLTSDSPLYTVLWISSMFFGFWLGMWIAALLTVLMLRNRIDREIHRRALRKLRYFTPGLRRLVEH